MSSTLPLIQLNADFVPSKLTVAIKDRGATWLYDGQSSLYRSSVMQVVFNPRKQGASTDYSLTLQPRPSGDQKAEEERLNAIDSHVVSTGQKFVLENDQHIARTKFSSVDDFETVEFMVKPKNDKYSGYFYARFNPNSVLVQILDREKSTPGNAVWKSVAENQLDYLGRGSLVIVDFQPTIFYYGKKNTLYPFSVQIKGIRVVAWDPKAAERDSAYKSHGELEGFGFNIPTGFTGPETQTDVPVTNLSEFDIKKYVVTDPIEGKNGRTMLFNQYGDSRGRVYVRGRGRNKFGIEETEQYPGVRNLVHGQEAVNTELFNAIQGTFDSLLQVIIRNSKRIYGEDYDEETVRELCGNPFYSQNDVDKVNPRVNLKLPVKTKEDGKPILPSIPDFRFFTASPPGVDPETGEREEFGTITEHKYENFEELEKFLAPGTEYEYIAQVRPVLINSKVYNTWRIVQLLVYTDQERHVAPTISGFAFPGYENADVESRSETKVLELNAETVEFTDPVERQGRKSFKARMNHPEGWSTTNLLLPGVHKIVFDMELEDDAKNNKYPYRNRCNCDDSQPPTKDMLSTLRDKLLAFCVEKSKELWGSPKKDTIVKALVSNLTKFGKKDTEKESPYMTIKCVPYENAEGGLDFPYEAYRYTPSQDGGFIRKINLNDKTDLLQVFYREAWVKFVVNLTTWVVDGKAEPSFKVAQVLLVPPPDIGDGVPFTETGKDDIVGLSNETFEAFAQVEAENSPDGDHDAEEKEALAMAEAEALAETGKTETVAEPVKVSEAPAPVVDVSADKAEKGKESESEDEESEEEESEEESD